MGKTGELWLASGENACGWACGRLGRNSQASHGDERGPPHQRACLMRAVNSCTRLYTDRSSRMSFVILSFAWMTVVWSRPPNSLPIIGSDASVNSRERYIATCL